MLENLYCGDTKVVLGLTHCTDGLLLCIGVQFSKANKPFSGLTKHFTTCFKRLCKSLCFPFHSFQFTIDVQIITEGSFTSIYSVHQTFDSWVINKTIHLSPGVVSN